VSVGVQFPINDPSVLCSAMAYATEHLGFAFTHSILQDHPFNFARRNVDARPPDQGPCRLEHRHLSSAEMRRESRPRTTASARVRYALAEEYAQVTYKLWEGSWEDDA